MDRLGAAAAGLVLGVATALVVAAVAIVPFLNPVWVGFEQDRAQAAAWTGFAPADLHAVTDAILADLVLGPPDFDVRLDGAPVLNEQERSHMRDVRGVFTGFGVAALAAAAVLAGAFALTRADPSARGRLWGTIGRAGRVVAVVTVVVGIAGLLFFDQAFELFHQLLFPGGNYLFDPSTDRLVQLFPQAFWIETSAGVGTVVAALAAAVAVVGGRRSARATASARPAASPAARAAEAR